MPKHDPDPQFANAFERLRLAARDLPQIEEASSYGSPALKVRGKFLCRVKDSDTLVLMCPLEEKQVLMEAAPDIYFETAHYRDWPAILARVSVIGDAELAHRLRRAFTVQGGTELRVELVVEPGLRRVVRAELPAGTPTPRWIWYSLFQGRELLGSGNLARGPDGIWSAEVWLGAQDCELMVGADNRALRGQAALSAGLPDGAVVSVALAPK